MKTQKNLTLSFFLLTLFFSCENKPDFTILLSNTENRKEVISTIAQDSVLAKELMAALMNGKHGMMIMNHSESMMKMMNEHPEMMKDMMSGMMEACKKDTSMMSSMCKMMMSDKEMMKKMMDGKKPMDKMDHKLHY